MSRHDLSKKNKKSLSSSHHAKRSSKAWENKQTRLLSFVLQPKIQRSKIKGMGQGENVNVI